MPSERVLIEIATVANMAGVAEAKAGFLGLQPAIVAAGVAFAGLVILGKEAAANAESQAGATGALTQAYATQKERLEDVQATIDAFLKKNARFIKDQYDVQVALANVVRTGLNPESEAFRVLNDALDLAVIKQIAVSDAADIITKAEAGASKGLKFLGITTEEYNGIMKGTLSDADKHAALLALIETRTKGGKETTNELTQSQQASNNAWKDLSEKIGPAVVAVQKDIADAMLIAIGIGEVEADLMGKIGVGITSSINQVITTLRALATLSNEMLGTHFALPAYLGAGGSALPGAPRGFAGGRASGMQSFAGGGDVLGDYLGQPVPVIAHAGEHIGPSAKGGGNITINIQGGYFLDNGPSMDKLANAIANRLGYATGR